MRRAISSFAALITILSWTATAGAVAITVYTDKAEWEAALSWQYLTEDFADSTLNFGVSYVSSESGHINLVHECYQDVLASQSQNEPMTTWTFQSGIFGYGGNWTLGGPGGSGNSLRVYIADDSLYVGFISNSFNGEFWGFTSDTPFLSVRLVGGAGDNQQHYCLDDMVYSPVLAPTHVDLPVPSPATGRLLLRVQNPYGIDQAIQVTGDGAEEASVSIFDAQGRLLRNLTANGRGGGEATFSWDGRTAHGLDVPASALFLKVQDGRSAMTRMIVFLR